MELFGETLSFAGGLFLLLALLMALGFEFVNGFHDTANAVATVIYTQPSALDRGDLVRYVEFSRRVDVKRGRRVRNRRPTACRTGAQCRVGSRLCDGFCLADFRDSLEYWYLVFRVAGVEFP